MMKKARVGIVGCGNICGTYFWQLGDVYTNYVELVACADLDFQRAKARAAERPGVQAMTVKNLLASKDIDIVVNLTIPAAHFSVAMKAIKSGKHVYNEKPLCLTRSEGLRLLEAAKAQGVRVGGAPDTFLGGGLQTSRKLLDDGAIGKPLAATAFMMCRGHENWHPNPDFFYKKGGGPMFDMGPYYVTALVSLFGPVVRVAGSTKISFPTRTITSQPKNGELITVETPTHLTGVMDFASGVTATVIMSFDVVAHSLLPIQVHGEAGSMVVNDPNSFNGDILVHKLGGPSWEKISPTHFVEIMNRGTGVADMALAIDQNRPHRVNGDLCYHVLDVMHAFDDSSRKGRHVMIKSTCTRPEPLKPGLAQGILE